MIKFTTQHEWIKVDGDIGIVGITDYAQEHLGDVVFTELPALGKVLTKGQEAAVVESVKAASEVYSPVSGIIVEVNPALQDQPDLINSDPMGSGWFFKLKLDHLEELDTLMDDTMYKTLTQGH